MYYSAGTYESFAHPEKPKDVDKKSAYIIGTGLAGLTAAFYLVRDGQMKGEHIHVFEKLDLAGGSCDGRKDITKGFFMRGGREMDNHFEVMCGTPSVMFRPSRRRASLFWMSIIGSTSTIPTILCAAPA